MKQAIADAAQDVAALKLSAAGAGVSTLAMLLSWDASVAIVGVPMNVLLAGLTGALLGIGYGESLGSRRRLIMVTLVNAFIASGVTAIMPYLPLFGWLGKAPAAAVALILGFTARWAVPAAIERIPGLIRGFAQKVGGKDA